MDKIKRELEAALALLKGVSVDNSFLNIPLQQIFYGAPGTGKSYEINRLTRGENVIRTTFHPDSDYSTFVGCYKPIMGDPKPIYGFDSKGQTVKVEDPKPIVIKERKIEYKFIKQAFLKAYLLAWKKYTEGKNYVVWEKVKGRITLDLSSNKYEILSVNDSELKLSREFDFNKSQILNIWPTLWTTKKFIVPSGKTPGRSVEFAIAKWIDEHVDSCTEADFEKGWAKLLDEIKSPQSVSVQNATQTYYLFEINGETDKLKVRVEEATNTKETIRKYFDGTGSNNLLLEELAKILKSYNNNDFDMAWQQLMTDVNNLTSRQQVNTYKPQFLIIEEINRGNCAQIFGDVFQLLDRGGNRFSEYPIEADTDLQKEIENAFKNEKEYKLDCDINVDGVVKDYVSNYEDGTLSKDIQAGRILLLPPNLYIWATMNTSDQSLFPIDSAFKRRWEWKYIKIAKGKDKDGNDLDWKIVVKDKDGNIVKINDKESLPWWDFISKINDIIASMTSSADKQLGYFFCKADSSGTITPETFVSKVIFYLWNDVFKDYGFEDAKLFQYNVTEGGKEITKDLTFPDFYNEEGEHVNTNRLKDFLENVMNY